MQESRICDQGIGSSGITYLALSFSTTLSKENHKHPLLVLTPKRIQMKTCFRSKKRLGSKRPTTSNRIGAATLEAAFIMPVLFVIISGTIEISSAIYLKESLKVAAYEGARNAINRDASDATVRNRVEAALNSRNIKLGDQTISTICTISPQTDTAEILEPITVTVTVDVKDNLIVPFSWLKFANYTEISADVTMLKEFTIDTED